MYVNISGSCLKQDEIAFNHGETVNIYIVYDLKSNLNNFDPTLQNCLLGAAKLTKNSCIDKYEYASYGTGFDSKVTFSHSSGGAGVNLVVFGADMSSSVHANTETKSILILGKGLIQGLEYTTLYAEKMYSISFTATRKKLCFSLHYNEEDSYLFVNDTDFVKFKAKDSDIVANPLRLENISKDFSSANMKKDGICGSVFDFSVDYRVTEVDDILDIHKYLMKKGGIIMNNNNEQ